MRLDVSLNVVGASGLRARLGLAVCEEDRSWNALVEVEQHLGVDRESGVAQQGCHLVGLAAVDIDLHRVAAVALRLQPRFVADVEAEQQWSTGAQYPPKVAENRGDRVVGDVDQRPEGEQCGDRAVGEVQVLPV